MQQVCDDGNLVLSVRACMQFVFLPLGNNAELQMLDRSLLCTFIHYFTCFRNSAQTNIATKDLTIVDMHLLMIADVVC